jgi:hypothetical protein
MPSSRRVSPNRGAAVHANDASLEIESVAVWQKNNGIDTTKQVKLVRLSHMRYQHKDMAKITTFMKGTY